MANTKSQCGSWTPLIYLKSRWLPRVRSTRRAESGSPRVRDNLSRRKRNMSAAAHSLLRSEEPPKWPNPLLWNLHNWERRPSSEASRTCSCLQMMYELSLAVMPHSPQSNPMSTNSLWINPDVVTMWKDLYRILHQKTRESKRRRIQNILGFSRIQWNALKLTLSCPRSMIRYLIVHAQRAPPAMLLPYHS